jgi:putative endonuclease
MPGSRSRQELGRRGEDLACAELERQGLKIVDRNWRCALGEIDIVAAEVTDASTTLVFCEVKTRSGLGFGHPLEAITYSKMRTLRQRAAQWTREHGIGATLIRVDAIGVVIRRGREPELVHVKAVS